MAVASETDENHPKLWKWRLEWLLQTTIQKCVSALPGAFVFRLGEVMGGLAWYFMKSRQHVVLRNLRIALHGEHDLPTLRKMAQESFRRTGANLLSAAHATRLPVEKISEILTVENPELIEAALASGGGLVLMPPHMGNWEVLTRMNRFFPPGHAVGALYRPLNNPLLDAQVLTQREADGTRLFSKRDSFHHIAGFIREGGIIGILADQRAGELGEVGSFFGRLTRTSPLPSLMARRSKCQVFAMSLRTVEAGKWSVRYHPVEGKITTESCMAALETAMKTSPLDVFWLQERWKLFIGWGRDKHLRKWLGPDDLRGRVPHRAVLWMPGAPEGWLPPENWTHPDVPYEVVPREVEVDLEDRDALQRFIADLDGSAALPIDFILGYKMSKVLRKAAYREGIRIVSLPPPQAKKVAKLTPC